MMKNLYVVFAFLIVPFLMVGQGNEQTPLTEINKFATSLESRGITNYFYVDRYCLGDMQIFNMSNGSMCTASPTYHAYYLFWKEEDGRTMIKKFDNCSLFFSLEVADSEILEFVAENWTEIQAEEVKKYETAIMSDGPILRTDVQPCHRKFMFKQDGGTVEKTYNLFQLTNDSGELNINYEHNNSLKLVELDRKLDSLISTMDDTFRRQI